MMLAFGDKAGQATNRGEPPAGVSGAINVIAHEEDCARSAAAQEGTQVGSPRPAQRAGQMAMGGPLRVLIVEDDRTIGPLLAEVLEDLGHFVCAIETDAGAAVAAARRYRPDLMIVDIRLGTTSGISAVKEILEQGFVPHVFVTGDSVRDLPLGPEAVLVQKPYRPSDLVIAITRATARLRAPEEAGAKIAGSSKSSQILL